MLLMYELYNHSNIYHHPSFLSFDFATEVIIFHELFHIRIQMEMADAPSFALNYTFDTGKIPLKAVTEIELKIKTKSGKKYSMMDVEIMMPTEDSKPRFGICKAEIIFGGRNLPCFRADVANGTIELKKKYVFRSEFAMNTRPLEISSSSLIIIETEKCEKI